MATEAVEVTNIAHVIQLAVAPVFLIAGIGSMLGVLTNRLGRIVDRARKLHEQLSAADSAINEALRSELRMHARRARLVHLAIGCCAFCALMICAVVMVLFLGALFEVRFSSLVAVIFIGAMSAFIMGLLFFLREIHLAINHLRIGPNDPIT